MPGAMELLKVLPLERWAIVTSCTRALANVRIAAAGLPWPRHLVTSTDVNHGKPDPEHLPERGADAWRTCEGVHCYRGCSLQASAPAKLPGARVLALRTTAIDAELQQAGADWIVDDCAGIFLQSSAADEDFLLLGRRTNSPGFRGNR